MESRKVIGWRSRLEEERLKLVRDVWSFSGQTVRTTLEFVTDAETLQAANESSVYRDPNKGARRSRMDALFDFNNRIRRLKWAELNPEVKAERIQKMVVYNREYRKQNRAKVNGWAKKYREENREINKQRKKIARAQLSPEKAEHVRLVAAIYAQVLALAGLSPWQKK